MVEEHDSDRDGDSVGFDEDGIDIEDTRGKEQKYGILLQNQAIKILSCYLMRYFLTLLL